MSNATPILKRAVDVKTIYWRAAAEFTAESRRQRRMGNVEFANTLLARSRDYRRIANDPAVLATLLSEELEEAQLEEDGAA